MRRTIISFVLFFVLVIRIEAFPNNDKKGPSTSNATPDIIMTLDDAITEEITRLNSKDIKVRPKCAGGKTYCMKSETYPTEYVKKLVKDGVLANSGYEDPTPEFNLTQRVDATADIPICASRERIIKPEEGETEEGEWLHIPNVEGYKQGIRVEECVKENDKCSLLPDGLEARCEQKYIYRTMIGLKGGDPTEANFKFPSCCVCYINNPGRNKRKLPPPPKRESRQVGKSLQVVDPDTIVFPQGSVGTRNSFTAPFTITAPPCEGSTAYCTKAVNYPKEHIKRLLKMKAFEDNFITHMDVPAPFNLGNRHLGGEMTNHLCDADLKRVVPEAAPTKNDVWEYIVQIEEGKNKLIQALQIELCLSPESECNFADKFPFGYKTVCRQKYVLRPMVSISETGEPHTNHFKLPSCCVCHVTSTATLSARFGTAKAPMTPASAKNNRRKRYI